MTKTASTICKCGVQLGDHCPKCSECDCSITTGKVHPNSDCTFVERQKPSFPFSRR